MLSKRRTVYWLAGVTLGLVAIFGQRHAAEEWYIYQLDSDDPTVVDAAATRLGEMKSLRAIDPLVALALRELEDGPLLWYRGPIETSRGFDFFATRSKACVALAMIGEPAGLAIGRIDRRPETLEKLRLIISEGQQLSYLERRSSVPRRWLDGPSGDLFRQSMEPIRWE